MGGYKPSCRAKKNDMSNKFNTEQEEFWAGEFGDEYSRRVAGSDRIAGNISLFSKILARTEPITSVIEFGANIGLNLRALRSLLPRAKLVGVEINERAVSDLRKVDGVEVNHSSIYDFEPSQPVDLAFTKTFLIHIPADRLGSVYEKLYAASSSYVLLVEYFNPTPTEIVYRGHKNKLFKRDFAGEMMARFSDLSLVDYGFVYHGDKFFQDDVTWFLMKKEFVE